ncbi:hypothetical protein BaRGS_00031069, partial [Batillaria attramentaria]
MASEADQSEIKRKVRDVQVDAKGPRPAQKHPAGCRSWTCCVVTIICCWLLHCTLGFTYSFGNITPYLTSYLRNVTGDDYLDYADTLWIQITMDISTCVLTASTFGTYWAIQESFPLTILTYGVIGGIPHALLYPAAINIAVRWVPDKIGFIAGLILTGYGCGSFSWNQLTTWFINPDNLQPELHVGEDVYYTQPELLKRVPECFILVGCVFAAMQLLSLALICEAPFEPEKTTEIVSEITKEKQALQPAQKKETTETSFIDVSKSYGSISEGQKPDKQERPQYHPLEVIRSRVFWTLWAIWFISQLGTSFVINLFKAYGQTFITDDHFLTLVASFSSIFNALGRPFWGLIGDRVGYRIVALLCQCMAAALVATFVTTEDTGRAAFFIWVCAMFLSMCGFFTMKAALMLALFGSKYFNSNLGLLITNGVFGAILTGIIAPVLKDAFGWHGMFYFGFGGIFV